MNISTDSDHLIHTFVPHQDTSHASFNRSRERLRLTLSRLFMIRSAQNVLFITATFPVQLTRDDAMHRFEKLLRKLRGVSRDYLWVFERGLSGHVHFHLLLPVPFNVQEGVDLERFSEIPRANCGQKRKLLNKPTRDLEKSIQESCKQFGIGRTEVAPLYKDPRAITSYLLKSVTHNRHYRKVDGGLHDRGDKGAKWWSCSQSLKAVHGAFSSARSPFREAAKELAVENACKDLDELKELKGRHWGFHVKLRMEANMALAKAGYHVELPSRLKASHTLQDRPGVRSFTTSPARAEDAQDGLSA
jgi:hypothetical protein